MASRRAMLDDLAREAGVSKSTASRAIRNIHGVNARTRTRVVNAAKKLNYVPNNFARYLSMGRTNLIALVTPPVMTMTPQDCALARIESLAKAEDKRLVHLSYDRSECDTLLTTALEQSWCGILLFPNTPPVETKALVRSLANVGIPVVLMGESKKDLDYVGYDQSFGMRLLLDHAASLGRRKAAVIASEAEVAVLGTTRKFSSFRQDLAVRGMELTRALSYGVGIPHGPALYRAAYEAMEKALNDGLDADLVMAANDVIGVAAMNCLQSRGIRVPDDVAVTGFDDNEWAMYARPALTSVKRPLEEMVEFAWNLLKRRLEGETGEAKNVMLLPSIVVRESTAGASGAAGKVQG